MDKPTTLSEKTLIPIGAIVLVFGASAWLTTVWKQGDANAAQISEVKANQLRDIDKLYEKLDKISDKLDALIEKSTK
jgi:formyltetrahydrofolate synthetase